MSQQAESASFIQNPAQSVKKISDMTTLALSNGLYAKNGDRPYKEKKSGSIKNSIHDTIKISIRMPNEMRK